MDLTNPIMILAGFAIGAVAGGFFISISRQLYYSRRLRVAQRKAAHTIAEANVEAKTIAQSARDEAEKMRFANENELRERRNELAKQENRVTQKVENLERKLETLDTRERALMTREKSIDDELAKVEAMKGQEQQKLEEVAGLTTQEAKDHLIDMVESEMQVESARRIRQWEQRIKEEADEKARNIIIHAIQRSASDIVAETTVSVVPIPSTR